MQESPLVTKSGVQPGRQYAGGMWVRGLCFDCNNTAGNRYDTAYGLFTDQLRGWFRTGKRLAFGRIDVPAVSLDPGLVSRAILYGFHAINPRLRVIFPELAKQLLNDTRQVRLPSGLRLRAGAYFGSDFKLSGGVLMQRVLGARETHFTFGEVFFPPLAWVLTPDYAGLAVDHWASADEWPLYSVDRTSVDLRWIAGQFPIVEHPSAVAPNDWMTMFSSEITPFVQGQKS
ncbi:hypothetical protein E6C70_14745 [Glaciibacter flavus]|uniref:Uncharacterized protein n=1 Tax=Orlajensenia flava TaxID=2565934 RepID=A0A4S4FKF5_9MICO|nr:hypothetical protein E6C70_15025 [Glaciibacter flavus]THG30618.1 hypothetical protein E6C70_14745 [Glaciibacter flavus]